MFPNLLAALPFLVLASASPIFNRQIITNTSSIIISGRSPQLCLSVQGGRQAVINNQISNGTPVITVACESASYWDINHGSGSVILTGTQFALDIGLEPHNNGALKVWQSYPSSKQQTWYLTPDNRIAQTGGNQCLDQGENGPQTYECTTGNTNQVWIVAGLPTPVEPSTTILPVVTSVKPITTKVAPVVTSVTGTVG